MNLKSRFLLLLCSIIILFLSSAGIAVTSGLIWTEKQLTFFAAQMYQDPYLKWGIIGISLLLFLFSLRVLFVSLAREKDSPGVDRLTEVGHVHISLSTLESLAVKAAWRVQGIRDLTARVRHDGSSVGIGLKLVVDGERPIQELSEELQQAVKIYLEEIAGVSVNQVSVYVTDTEKPNRSRVRVE